jgi:RNA polymerase-binding transcription factor DksA
VFTGPTVALDQHAFLWSAYSEINITALVHSTTIQRYLKDKRQGVPPMSEQRQQLLDLQQQLQQRLSAVQRDLRQGHDADSAEQAQQRENDEVLQQLEQQLQRELLQLHLALERQQRGDYGLCEQCGEAIAPARLKLLPFALRCQHCA